MSMLFGMYEPDEGEIYIRGEKVKLESPNHATKLRSRHFRGHSRPPPESRSRTSSDPPRRRTGQPARRTTLYREQFDLCVSRAVANLSSLSEYCLPFVKMGGAFISYKSGEVDEEATQAKRAIYLLGGEVKDIYKFDLFDQKRSFVVIEKERKTPKAYPRKAGTPTKEPLQ